MQSIPLEWTINEEMRNIVFQALNNEWNITFYINSTWWICSCAEQIIDLINENKDRVTLVASNYIASNAFNIFFRSECKRKVLPKTEWMAHMSRIDTSISWKWRIQSTTKWQIKNMWKEAKTEEKILKKLWISKKIRKQFLKEYNIYFTTKQLKNMLSKSECQ